MSSSTMTDAPREHSTQERRASESVGLNDPPLFMSGHHFVAVSADLSQQSSGVNRASSDGPSLTRREDVAMDERVVDQVTENPAASADTEEILKHEEEEEDEELVHAVNIRKQQAAFVQHEQREIDWLQITGRQLEEMVADADNSCHIEYFDRKYFSDQAQLVWQDRQASPSRIRGTIQRSSNLQERSAPQAPGTPARSGPFLASITASHPLVHRKAQRNEERRAAFRKAALERRQLDGHDVSVATSASIYLPQRELFERDHPYPTSDILSSLATATAPTEKTHPSHEPSADEVAAPDAGVADEAAESVPAAADEKQKTLSALLAEQTSLLSQMRQHDEQVYQPLLSSFFRYDAQVQSKMTNILAMVSSSEPPFSQENQEP